MTFTQRNSVLRLSASLGLAVAFTLSGLAFAQRSESLATATASFEPAAIERGFDGTVEAVHQSTVSAQTGGRIAKLNYDVDDFVVARRHNPRLEILHTPVGMHLIFDPLYCA